MKTFLLPDLGEGLAEAEIVNWHVKEGDSIESDALLVSVETAKAVVDVPSPYSGRILKLHAQQGDIVAVNKPLVDFDVVTDESKLEDSNCDDSENRSERSIENDNAESREDEGTVVGAIPSSSDEVATEFIIRRRPTKETLPKPKAAPTARAKAKELGVPLSAVTPTGHKGQIIVADVELYASQEHGHASGSQLESSRHEDDQVQAKPHVVYDRPQPIRGPRRSMAAAMSAARDQIAATSLFDDADINNWPPGEDVTVRIIRALSKACLTEPGLNCWYDAKATSRTIHRHINLALAVDTPDGLIVPVIRNVGNLEPSLVRQELNRVRKATRDRSVSPQDMQGATITLSNFGMMAGRYATPVIVPPQVAILGTGGIRHDVVPVLGGIEVHRRIPLSLTFDHRCVTGGEACRFLATLIDDLGKTR